MTSEERGGPRKGRPDTTTNQEAYTDHETYMLGLDRRIRWLRSHRHWWLKSPDGRSQLEFLDRRDAA